MKNGFERRKNLIGTIYKRSRNRSRLPDSFNSLFTTHTIFTAASVAFFLWAIGINVILIAFFLIISFFLWKALSRPDIGEVRGVFEFYLSAHDILREDEKRWYGFEVQEVIDRGEYIRETMLDAPPLVYYTLGALYNYLGKDAEAVQRLQFISQDSFGDERKRFTGSAQLHQYLKVLRKVESEPSEHPRTAAAIRALERARRNRLNTILEESRRRLNAAEDDARINYLVEENEVKSLFEPFEPPLRIEYDLPMNSYESDIEHILPLKKTVARRTPDKSESAKKSISEVLRDVYDKTDESDELS